MQQGTLPALTMVGLSLALSCMTFLNPQQWLGLQREPTIWITIHITSSVSWEAKQPTA